MWVGWIGGAELVTLPYESLGGVWEVGDEIRDVTGGNEMFCGCEEDVAELGFTSTSRGGELEMSEGLLCFPGERLPVRFSKVGVGNAWDLWGLGGEVSPRDG